MAFSADASIEKNLEEMNRRLNEVRTGMITVAVRDSTVGTTIIHKGDFMGMTKNHEVFAKSELEECFLALLNS